MVNRRTIDRQRRMATGEEATATVVKVKNGGVGKQRGGETESQKQRAMGTNLLFHHCPLKREESED